MNTKCFRNHSWKNSRKERYRYMYSVSVGEKTLIYRLVMLASEHITYKKSNFV